jgi:hypothetical protein
MKRGIVISLGLFITVISFGQFSYYETAESFVSGAKVITGKQLDNFHRCQVFEDGKIISYSPDVVTKYRTKEGREYVSKEISISNTVTRVFLELVTEGRSTLYHYLDRNRGYFFLEKEAGELYLIPDNEGKKDESLNEFLIEISSDCPAMAEIAGSARYKRVYLSNFVKTYNVCRPLSFPEIRYSVLLGFSMKRLLPSQNNNDPYLEYFDLTSVPAFSAGASFNIPVAMSGASFQTELFYSNHKISYKAIAENSEFELSGELQTLKMPLMIRYDLMHKKLRPYVMAGIVLEYNLRHDFTLSQTPAAEGDVGIPDRDYSVYMKDFMKGIGAGAGVEFKLTRKQSIVLELRYDYLASVSAGSFINNSGVSLMTGLSF